MTIIAHHRDRVYSDRQMTCDWCNKVVDPDVDDWGREGIRYGMSAALSWKM